jgi:hypothetical protein
VREQEGPKPRPRSKASAKQRAAARRTAHALIEQGRFGGRVGQAHTDYRNRLPKGVPKPGHLIAMLRAVEKERSHGEKGVLSQIVERVPEETMRVDRDAASAAIASALEEALYRKNIPRRAVVGPAARRVELVWKTRMRPLASGELLIDLHDPREGDFIAYGAKHSLRVLALLGDPFVHHGPRARAAEEFVVSSLRLDDLLDRARELLAERAVA